MTILQILQYPDSRLRRKSRDVTDACSKEIKQIIKNMLETLANAENCAALAATQLDIENPPSITVINVMDNNENVLCLINPKIIAREGSRIEEEGCMSVFPHNNIRAKVERATKIKVNALDVQNNPIEFEAEDYLAKAIQHECDHLDGILYIDHLSKLKRSMLEKKIHKIGMGSGLDK